MSFYKYNLARALSECFVKFSDNVALCFDDKNYTFREIVNMAVHWAEFFVFGHKNKRHFGHQNR